MTGKGRNHVLIAGGGVAALETVLALRELAGHAVDITLLASEPEFVYRPVTVAEAFELGEARSYDLAELVRQAHAELAFGALSGVDPDDQVAITETGERLRFDTLVVATGARAVDPLPGALVFRGRSDVPELRELLGELTDGHAHSVVLALASERLWPLPLYELALMTAAHLREHGSDASVSIVTPEEEPLALFGPEAQRAVRPLLEARGIDLRTSSLPAYIDGHTLFLAGGGHVHTERVITMPGLIGPGLAGLPQDGDGFIPVDEHGRVTGRPDVFAAGDVTAFPLKQGGLAAQQADAVAAQIAADVGAPVQPAPFSPVLRGLLLTGGAPLYLRCEPQRLPRAATVAIDASPFRMSRGTSAASGQALWWPPAKIAGRYLSAHLATARPRLLVAEPLADRVALPGGPPGPSEQSDALELALLLAECDARWGDYPAALSALAAAEALQGSLPPEYEAKRRKWLTAQRFGD